jgi:hypothetical protein
VFTSSALTFTESCFPITSYGFAHKNMNQSSYNKSKIEHKTSLQLDEEEIVGGSRSHQEGAIWGDSLILRPIY